MKRLPTSARSAATRIASGTAVLVALAGLANGARDLWQAIGHAPVTPQDKTNADLLQRHFQSLPLFTQTVAIKQAGATLDMLFDVYDNGDIHVRYGNVEQWFPAKQLQFAAGLQLISSAYAQSAPTPPRTAVSEQILRKATMVDLDQLRAQLPAAPPPVLAAVAGPAPGASVARAFLIADTMDDHSSPFTSSSRTYQRVFRAEPGYVITDKELRISSLNGATDVSAQIIGHGQAVRVTYTLASGPAFNRYRGWIKGTLQTTQAKAP